MSRETHWRYLLVGAGRSGSSLLAAILVDSGANFNMLPVQDWNAGGGAYAGGAGAGAGDERFRRLRAGGAGLAGVGGADELLGRRCRGGLGRGQPGDGAVPRRGGGRADLAGGAVAAAGWGALRPT